VQKVIVEVLNSDFHAK